MVSVLSVRTLRIQRSFSLIPELVPTKWGLVMDRILVLSRKFTDILTKVQGFLWRILELHILKMVAFFSVWVALEEVNIERVTVMRTCCSKGCKSCFCVAQTCQ